MGCRAKIVYYKGMKFTDRFSIVLDSQEHAILEEMASFCAQFDFTEHHDPEIFERVWDKILDAHLEIVSQDDLSKIDSWIMKSAAQQHPLRTQHFQPLTIAGVSASISPKNTDTPRSFSEH